MARKKRLKRTPSPVTPAERRRCRRRLAARWLNVSRALMASAGLLACTSMTVRAADWPQILGPQRNAIAVGQQLPDTLPSEPSIAWTASAGQGYAGPAVVGDRVLLFHRVGQQECLDCLERPTGKRVYRQCFEAHYRGGVNPDNGPRCVPLVDREDVVLYGAAGVLRVIRLADGTTRWQRDLYAEFSGREGYFGAGNSPIVVGDFILVNVGGRDGAGVVALDRKTGTTVWQKTNCQASYSAPVIVEGDQGDRVLMVTRLEALLLEPATGHIVGRRPFGMRGPTVNAATPIVIGQRAFLTASYGIGGMLIRLDRPDLEPIWANDQTLSSQYNTPVYCDGYLFGIHGREDLPGAALRCVELTTGRVAWSVPDFGVAHLVRAADRIILLQIDGTVTLISCSAESFTPLGRFPLAGDGSFRALPALSDGVLFVRDQSKLMAVQLAD